MIKNAELMQEAMAAFAGLLQEAKAAGDPEPTAMTLATSDSAGRISARTVLLKEQDDRGFVFYTNTLSTKGRQLEQHPRAALLFLWKTLRHQVQFKIEGVVEPVSASEADAYFQTRPRGSQIGAWASEQSQTLDQRSTLLQRVADFEAKFDGQIIPRPPYWSGYRVLPDVMEQWFGAPFRLHERTRYEVIDGSWEKRLLFP